MTDRRARASYESGLARAQQLGVPRAIAGCSLGLAAVARIEGEPDQARALLQEAARIHRVHGDLGGLAHAFVQGALLHAASGHHESATQLLAGADAARARLHIVTPGSEEADIARARAPLSTLWARTRSRDSHRSQPAHHGMT